MKAVSKERIGQKFMAKKTMRGVSILLVLVLILTGMYIVPSAVSKVQASDAADIAHVESLSIADYVKESGKTAPKPTNAEYRDWLFAGWYKEDTCENAVEETVTEGTYYAKFVPSEILSAKCQVTANTTADTTDPVKLRLVSSVDSLRYDKVGFKVDYTPKKGAARSKDYNTKNVYTQIVANAGSVEFKYEPSLFHNMSKYFITYSITDIPATEFETGFYITPYWITLDGTMVYGVSRYVRVEDSYLNILNIPVRLYSDAEVTSGDLKVEYDNRVFQYVGCDAGVLGTVTATDNDSVVTCVNAGTDGKDAGLYANLRFQLKDHQVLPDEETFYVFGESFGNNGKKVRMDVADVRYVNPNPTPIDITADTSWYNPDASEFTLYDAGDLYGFANLVNGGNSLSGKTVKLGANIMVNRGDAATWRSKVPDDINIWDPIGWKNSEAHQFQGIFDGQGYTISGICVTRNNTVFAGLFGKIIGAGTVQNLRLENSYILGAADHVGSIVGWFHSTGKIENVYSNAIVAAKASEARYGCGGIAGRASNGAATSGANISNCWFDGTIDSTIERTGGIVGSITALGVGVDNCLYSGEITATKPGVGGLCGFASNMNAAFGTKVNINGSVSVGTINVSGVSNVGSLVGTNSGSCIAIENSYASKNTYAGTFGTNVPSSGCSQLIEEQMKALGGYIFANLDFDSTWSARQNKTPALEIFTARREILDTTGVQKADTTWFTDGSGGTIIDQGDLYGFMKLVIDGKTTKDTTIALGANITLNQGEAEDWEYSVPGYLWIPIGKGSASGTFSGTFDGKSHTISGIYVNENTQFAGFFAASDGNSTIKNFRLVNSYLCSSSATAEIGAISGRGLGKKYENIYTDAIIKCYGNYCGGIVGQTTFGSGEKVFSGCWFDGRIDMTATGRYGGGILGGTGSGSVRIENCLNSGEIITSNNTAGPNVGGLVGGIYQTVTIISSMNVGSVISMGSPNTYGSVIGYISADPDVTVTNVYATNESCIKGSIGALSKTEKTTGEIESVPRLQLIGETAKTTASGLFSENGMWKTVEGSTPELNIPMAAD